MSTNAITSTNDNSQNNTKKVFKTGLVGIRPADNVMIKGYLRVLLRLDVDLEWVSANQPDVDLFMINEEFKHADTVTKLLSDHSNTPVLFITRAKVEGTGGLKGDILSLPIKKVGDLEDWLFKHIAVLQVSKGLTTDSQTISTPKPVENQSVIENDVKDKKSENDIKEQEQEYTPLVELIKKLKLTNTGTVKITEGKKIIAIIELDKSIVWPVINIQDTNNYNILNWQIDFSASLDSNLDNCLDLKQWLWDASRNVDEIFNSLVNPQQKFYLNYWVKPSKDERSKTLILLTAIEKKALTPAEIGEVIDLTKNDVNNILARLIFSGYLVEETYDKLSFDKNHNDNIIQNSSDTNQKDLVVDNSSPLDKILQQRAAGHQNNNETSSTISNLSSATNNDNNNEPVTEKKGFLSRLRRKLGI